MDTITCRSCPATFVGTRSDARRLAYWEPYSNATQQLLDHGPMVCADCVNRTLLAVQDAMLLAAREGRF